MFPDYSTLLTFIAACAAIVVVPGPTVTVIIANSLTFGPRAGLLNIAGTQLGVMLVLAVVALGLEAITETLAWLFDWIRLAGAAYLIWLGYKLLTSDGTLARTDKGLESKGSRSFFWQGFWVCISNPKVLLFFGAFLPQFIDPAGNAALQTFGFGLLFIGVATIFDSGYAIAAGRAGRLLTKRRVRAVERGAGSLMIGGGLWLGLTRN